jgi:hypothetical protein
MDRRLPGVRARAYRCEQLLDTRARLPAEATVVHAHGAREGALNDRRMM